MVPCFPHLGVSARRFPRTRGDGPPAADLVVSLGVVPPHPRGWSPAFHRQRVARRGSPAPAGMVPTSARSGHSLGWFPRTRGDGPQRGRHSPMMRMVPPHPRGWSPAFAVRAVQRRGSPAPAGMVPTPIRHKSRGRGFPRTRGDGPDRARGPPSGAVVPPHPRGWSPYQPPAWARAWGSPAPAGMVPRWRSWSRFSLGFPRTRGDGPEAGGMAGDDYPVPPHPRGWSRRAKRQRRE